VISSQEDLEQVGGVIRKIDLSDVLMAHTTLMDAVGKLRIGAERYFVNLGLFSNYFLTERLVPHLNSRGRKIDKETSSFFEKFEGAIPTDYEGAKKILGALDYNTDRDGKNSDEFELFSHSSKDLNVVCILTKSASLDTKGQASESVPSYLAVSALNRARWVILTNGRLWRLYSNRISSPSTNYFEIDLESITGETDPKLQYFVSLFSSQSLIPRADGTDLDSIFEGGLKYARDVEDQLRLKIFEGQLFLNLIRAILSHSNQKKYSEAELANSKATALRLLYRLLFVLYAESRSLLPVSDSNYKKISLDSIRQQLSEHEKNPNDQSLWTKLEFLFQSIQNGNVDANIPEYDGELFRATADLDNLKVKNRFLAPALRELCEWNGRGIDYQNLGVRHLGSLYEALLEYDVRQAKEDLVAYKDGTLDASYAADLKQKPQPFVDKGEIYLTSKGQR
jgi:hypothetical protein